MTSQVSLIDRQANQTLRTLTQNRRLLLGLVRALSAATHPRLKYALGIYGYDTSSKSGLAAQMPVNPGAYQYAIFHVRGNLPSDDTTFVYRQGTFGYTVFGDFRRIGTFEFMRLDEEGNVLEASFGSPELLREFTHHLRGRTLTRLARVRVTQVQEGVFAYLRSRPEWMTRLEEFSVSRGWPAGIADEARLAYFDATTTDLPAWAAENSFTDEEMWLAGWYEKSYRRTGEVSYSVHNTHVIRIPYFRNGRIEVWRTRNLRRSQMQKQKYTSWPLNRSIDKSWRIEHRLYNGWRLSEARGKTLVITEGEFKCLIATRVGPLTVGVPGITEVDDRTIKALVQSRAKRYIVVLDRDPAGMAMMRVDGITDSQRAAYMIATRLREAGARNVLVGIIPDVRNGEKVGLDDLILDKGPEAFTALIDDAMKPHEYARRIRLSMVFCNLIRARGELRKALEHYEMSLARGGIAVPRHVHDEALNLLAEVNELYQEYLSQRFFGARRLDQPNSQYIAMFRTRRGIPQAERKLVLSTSGRLLPLELFTQDMLNLVFYPRDTPKERLFSQDSQIWLPFFLSELYRMRTGRATKRTVKLVKQGAEVIGATVERAVHGHYPIHQLALMAAIGQLTNWFPLEDYSIETGVQLLMQHEDYWDKLTEVPIVVFRKKSNTAVALVYVVSWPPGNEPDLAMDAVSQARAKAHWFMRSTLDDSTNATERYRRLTETIWPYWSERQQNLTMEVMARFGVSAETVTNMQLVALRRTDFGELMGHLLFRRSLNQAAQAGLFKRLSSGLTVARFSKDVVLIPVKNDAGDICAMRVLPLDLADHAPPVLPPQPRLVRHMYGEAKYLVRQFDPDRHLFMQEMLSARETPDLIVTFHELDGLSLAAGAAPVVALNSSLALGGEVISRIAESGARTIYLVMSGGMPASKYDVFAFDGLPGMLKELYDLSCAVTAVLPSGAVTPEFRVFVMSKPLTESVRTFGPDACQQAIRAGALPLRQLLQSRSFNPGQHDTVRRFMELITRFMDYLEQLALPDVLDSRPIDWYVRQSERLYLAIQLFADSQYQVKMPPVEEYLRHRLHLEDPVVLSELLRRRQDEREAFVYRPVHDLSSLHYELPEAFVSFFEAVMRPAEVAELPRNLLVYGSNRKSINDPNERTDVLTDPKSVVLQFLARQLRTTPPQNAQFTATTSGFVCHVTVAHNENVYLGSGSGSTKKLAERAAYHVILSKMTATGVAVDGTEAVEGAASAEASGEPVLHFQSDAVKSLAALKMDAGDSNYIGCVTRYAQAARLPNPQFTSEPAIQDGNTLAWSSTAQITLADGTELASEAHSGSGKKASQQMAASDLIARIWRHYEQ